MTTKVYMHIMTLIMKQSMILNIHTCTSNQKPDVLPLKSAPANLSTCPNSPSCLVDSTRIVYESAGSPPTCRVRCAIKRSSIMHCGPKPLEMMANHPAQVSDSSFHSIWSLLKVERGSSKENSIFWIFWICAIFKPPQTRGEEYVLFPAQNLPKGIWAALPIGIWIWHAHELATHVVFADNRYWAMLFYDERLKDSLSRGSELSL